MPVAADQKFLGLYLRMTLIAERILRMRGDGSELAEFLAKAALLMAGETVGFIAAEGEINNMRNTWRRTRILSETVIIRKISPA